MKFFYHSNKRLKVTKKTFKSTVRLTTKRLSLESKEKTDEISIKNQTDPKVKMILHESRLKRRIITTKNITKNLDPELPKTVKPFKNP